MSKRPPRTGEVVEKTENTLLVDGNALFKTGYFGAKDLYNEHGNHIGGVFQFITTLRKLLTEDLYHNVYVFWDGNFSGLLRYKIYEPYKSGRGKDFVNGTQPIDEAELEQRNVVWDYLSELNIKQLKDEIVESDDFIAYYCLTKKQNEKVTICTNDRDMAQLINESVRIYFCDKKIKDYVGLTNYNVYFGHHQENSLLLKTMVGDSSDTIVGIRGLGEKTLLDKFPELKEKKITIDEIITKASILQEERVKLKKPPLIILDNIINKITDGVQGKRIYEINETLINLKRPFITTEAVKSLKNLIEIPFNVRQKDFKGIIEMMTRDGIDKAVGEVRMRDYLVPFKNLTNRNSKY